MTNEEKIIFMLEELLFKTNRHLQWLKAYNRINK
jgi:hypothetical protein